MAQRNRIEDYFSSIIEPNPSSEPFPPSPSSSPSPPPPASSSPPSSPPRSPSAAAAAAAASPPSAPLCPGDVWNSSHVKLPCSFKNLVRERRRVRSPLGVEIRCSSLLKWDLIVRAMQPLLRRQILLPAQLQQLVSELHPAHRASWPFDALHRFFDAEASEDERALVFSDTLPQIAALVLELPSLSDRPLPLLLPQQPREVTLSQRHAASLLACAFFSLFPQRNAAFVSHGSSSALPSPSKAPSKAPSARKPSSRSPDASFPSINFCPDFFGIAEPSAAKYRFLFNYFQRWTLRPPGQAHGALTLRRHLVVQQPHWATSQSRLMPVLLRDGSIEDAGPAVLQVDFANKHVGGGVLRRGAAQEEIRFLVCPELIVARLLTAELMMNEALLVLGAERYSSYAGYSATLAYAGNYVDATPRDAEGRLRTALLAMDAADYSPRNGGDPMSQFQQREIERELLKCYAAFSAQHPDDAAGDMCPVATGHWGCGAFFGHMHLKFLVQWMAASVLHRPLWFYSFDRPEFTQLVAELAETLIDQQINVAQVWTVLTEFFEMDGFNPDDLIPYIKNHFSSSSSSSSSSLSFSLSSTTTTFLDTTIDSPSLMTDD